MEPKADHHGDELAPYPTASRRNDISRAQWVYETLRDGIRSGTWQRGERMREEAIAQMLSVSRTPVREALARLQSRGILEASGGGLVVATISRAQTLELYAMREVLEGSVARFAAQHAAPSEVANLKHLCASFAATGNDPARLAELNRQIHDAMLDAAHNRYLVRMLEELSDTLALLPGTTFELPERAALAVGEHGAMIKAIEDRDEAAAEQAARAHIRRAMDARLILMQQGR